MSKAWQEPMVWLVFGLPAVLVLASVATIAVMIKAGGNDSARDTVQRTSQIQQSDLTADLTATERKLSARLSQQGGILTVQPLTGQWPTSSALLLTVIHPTDATQDAQHLLQPEAGQWQATAVLSRDNAWNLDLRPADGKWRLTGRLERAAPAATLAPALAAP